MIEENKALVQRYYQQVGGDLAGIDEIVTADFVDHHFPPGTPAGPDGVRQFFLGFVQKAFSDVRIEIEFMLAEGDKVDAHIIFRARHTADIGDIPAKGNTIALPAISTFRIADGKLAEAWEIFDNADFMAQLTA